MKNFFKKINKDRDEEQDSLNLDYGDFYTGRNDRPIERGDRDDRRGDDRRNDDRYERDDARRAEPSPERGAGGYYDVPKNPRGGYEEPDFRSDNARYYDADRPAERPSERPLDRGAEDGDGNVMKPRETWQEADAPGYRPARDEESPAPEAPPVFTPDPAPEYLYFTPSTYRDCREGIVKGLATGHVVVVRLRKLEAADVLRLFDYMMGAVLALDGEMARPAATTVVLVPKDVELKESDIEPDEDEPLPEEDFDEADAEADESLEEEYDEEEYDEEEYDEEEYDEEEYDEEEYDEEEYDEEEYDDEEYDEEEYDEEEYDEEEYDEEAYDEDGEGAEDEDAE